MNVHQGMHNGERLTADSLVLDALPADADIAPDPGLTFADLMAMDAANRPITPEMLQIARANMERARDEGTDSDEPPAWERLLGLFRHPA